MDLEIGNFNEGISIPGTSLPNLGWDVLYEANELPDAATPVWAKSGDATTIEISPAGILHIGATDAETVAYTKADTDLVLATGATIEFKLKMIEGGDFLGSAGFTIEIFIGESRVGVDIYTDGPADLFGWQNNYALDTTDDYHTYGITVKGTVAKLYVDKVERLTLTIGGGGSPNVVFTANVNEDTASEWLLDYLYYSTGGAFIP